jgi:DNA-binding transcriptional ArsR family regulator
MPPPADLETVRHGPRAAALLEHPLRLAILREAGEPRSATEIAARLGQSRQKVHYHVGRLRQAGYLALAGRRRRRGLVEQRVVASARRYVLAPDVLGALGAEPTAVADTTSAEYVMALAAGIQRDLARVTAPGRRVATIALAADVRFTSAAQRVRFGRALERAVRGVVARHAAPQDAPAGRAAPGRPFRLVVACHPVPRERDAEATGFRCGGE